jgi:hypothetical protein
MDVTKPGEFLWFGDMHGPKPYKFIGFSMGDDYFADAGSSAEVWRSPGDRSLSAGGPIDWQPPPNRLNVYLLAVLIGN